MHYGDRVFVSEWAAVLSFLRISEASKAFGAEARRLALSVKTVAPQWEHVLVFLSALAKRSAPHL
jgi:hypothetical protein